MNNNNKFNWILETPKTGERQELKTSEDILLAILANTTIDDD